jgi:ATP-dependent helicase HepA
MSLFAIGQRWISNSEPELGLGILRAFEHRRLTLNFPLTGEQRTYATQSAPLTRMRFSTGDWISDEQDSRMQVDQVVEEEGLLFYSGTDEHQESFLICEIRLSSLLQLNTPLARLWAGQLDANKEFELRLRTLQQNYHQKSASLRGLAGARIDLIPHQIYIAHEVASRHAPRVLLADEVGLGKTIEAGMIIHYQLLSGRADRILIIVPDSLQHQWLVEMLRRFNLRFSLFDEERCQAIESSRESQNPFDAEQLVICSLSLFKNKEFQNGDNRLAQALNVSWDLLVVDEAHHIGWSPAKPSIEYKQVAALTAKARGALLLTATPEQLGQEGHFARLQLLDPDRFCDLDAFVEEQRLYEPTLQAVEALLEGRALPDSAIELLSDCCTPEELGSLPSLSATDDVLRNSLIERLIDRHGTGRVLFRNTRQRISGFPERIAHPHALPMPQAFAPYRAHLNPEWALAGDSVAVTAWWKEDPRIPWLHQLLREHAGQKILLITAHADTVLDLEEAMRTRYGTPCALFHEGLSLIARDRAAAFFAEPEGAQLLICSEIGSEGRNFQFAHHLVLFDLPRSPDLLEQRIGRLDRIGQQQQIQLHIPYFEGSALESYFHWYHLGLQAFTRSCPAGEALRLEFHEELERIIGREETNPAPLDDLISKTCQRLQGYREQLQRGRDHLLELNSFRPDHAEKLINNIQQHESEFSLAPFMEELFDCFGVESEEHSPHCIIVHPGDHMSVPHFPALPEDGCTLTFDRQIALSREDMQFLSWEHPMATGAIELVTTSGIGSSVVTAIRHPSLTRGSLLLEALFVVDCPAPKSLQIDRFLPPHCIRILLDSDGENRVQDFPPETLSTLLSPVDKGLGGEIIKIKRTQIEVLVEQGVAEANQKLPVLVDAARHDFETELSEEINRLETLKQVNPNVRPTEIEHLYERRTQGRKRLKATRLRLDAVRIIFVA